MNKTIKKKSPFACQRHMLRNKPKIINFNRGKNKNCPRACESTFHIACHIYLVPTPFNLIPI